MEASRKLENMKLWNVGKIFVHNVYQYEVTLKDISENWIVTYDDSAFIRYHQTWDEFNQLFTKLESDNKNSLPKNQEKSKFSGFEVDYENKIFRIRNETDLVGMMLISKNSKNVKLVVGYDSSFDFYIIGNTQFHNTDEIGKHWDVLLPVTHNINLGDKKTVYITNDVFSLEMIYES